eukprot:g3456.t1
MMLRFVSVVTLMSSAICAQLVIPEFSSDQDFDQRKFADLVKRYGEVLDRAGGVEGVEESSFNLTKYWEDHPEYAKRLYGEIANLERMQKEQNNNDDGAVSFLEVSSKAAQSGCEVCVYVIENKEQHQPFLCRGLKAPSQQQTCVSILVSLMWWLENQVYWVNYGCQRSSDNGWEWVKPCPAHAICSFIQSLYDRTPFCPTDPKYRKPSTG